MKVQLLKTILLMKTNLFGDGGWFPGDGAGYELAVSWGEMSHWADPIVKDKLFLR